MLEEIWEDLFQSRNRGSFDFKRDSVTSEPPAIPSFNLVIEVLLISRNVNNDPEAVRNFPVSIS